MRRVDFTDMDEQLNEAIQARLAAAHSVLIASHVRPDGDAARSLIGLGLALENGGKDVQMVLADGISSSFRHLEGADKVKSQVERPYDTFITVDCADFRRTGKLFEKFDPPDINIDHHIT